MNTFPNFNAAIMQAHDDMLRTSVLTRRDRWQGVNVSGRPDAGTHELMHWTMLVAMPVDRIEYYQAQIVPNLPWADNHFAERVCGLPINPGIEWANWPWGQSANSFRDQNGQFDHNYMERYWPKFAGLTKVATLHHTDYHREVMSCVPPEHKGIRHTYGDLNDVVEQLKRDPTTRQAILPMFFPEDTGVRHGGRVPCSLFYQFMLGGEDLNRLDMIYYLRSCDLIRHFRDDIYLTVRLLLWVLERLKRTDDARWQRVTPGMFSMMIGNLHCFRNDFIKLQREHSQEEA